MDIEEKKFELEIEEESLKDQKAGRKSFFTEWIEKEQKGEKKRGSIIS